MSNVICPPDSLTPVSHKFQVDLEIFEFDRPLIKGERIMIHVGLNKISAFISKINYTLKKETGEILKKTPR